MEAYYKKIKEKKINFVRNEIKGTFGTFHQNVEKETCQNLSGKRQRPPQVNELHEIQLLNRSIR